MEIPETKTQGPQTGKWMTVAVVAILSVVGLGVVWIILQPVRDQFLFVFAICIVVANIVQMTVEIRWTPEQIVKYLARKNIRAYVIGVWIYLLLDVPALYWIADMFRNMKHGAERHGFFFMWFFATGFFLIFYNMFQVRRGNKINKKLIYRLWYEG
jgi:hypothetical protein